jgi:Family of unknown function (DUF6221)
VSDLIAFLRARLEEDAAAAQATAGPDWLEDGSPSLTVFTRQQSEGDRPGVRGIAWCSNGYDDDRANMVHIARHDPARVLREVEAKRAAVTRCELVLAAFADPAAGSWPDVSRRERSHAGATLCALAAVYADHPDYRQEWKP